MIKNSFNTLLEKLIRGINIASCFIHVIIKKSYATANLVIVLPCLLIGLPVLAGNEGAISFNSGGKVWKCANQQGFNGNVLICLSNSHLANSVRESGAEVSGSDATLLLDKEINTKAISGYSTNKSTNDSKRPANYGKFISGEIHTRAQLWFWLLVGFSIGISIFLIGFYALTFEVTGTGARSAEGTPTAQLLGRPVD